MYNRYEEEEDGLGVLGPAAALAGAAALTPAGRRLIKKGLGKAPEQISKPAAELRAAIMNPLGEVASKATGTGSDVLANLGGMRKGERLANMAQREAEGQPVWQRDFGQMVDEVRDTGRNLMDTARLAPSMTRSALRDNESLWKSATPKAKDATDQNWGMFLSSDLGKSIDEETISGARKLFERSNKDYASPQDAVLDYMNRVAQQRRQQEQVLAMAKKAKKPEGIKADPKVSRKERQADVL